MRRVLAGVLPTVLREEPQYRLLFGSQVLSVLGDRVTSVALPFAVLAVGGDVGDVALTSTAQFLPFVLLAEKRAHIEGLPADRYPRIRAAAEPLTNCDDVPAYYSFGVDLYIEGAQALLRRVKRAAG